MIVESRTSPAPSGSKPDLAKWPTERPRLAALVDLGLSNRQIGQYFKVSPDDVYMLRDLYGL